MTTTTDPALIIYAKPELTIAVDQFSQIQIAVTHVSGERQELAFPLEYAAEVADNLKALAKASRSRAK